MPKKTIQKSRRMLALDLAASVKDGAEPGVSINLLLALASTAREGLRNALKVRQGDVVPPHLALAAIADEFSQVSALAADVLNKDWGIAPG